LTLASPILTRRMVGFSAGDIRTYRAIVAPSG
jgi:hypothetical protein